MRNSPALAGSAVRRKTHRSQPDQPDPDLLDEGAQASVSDGYLLRASQQLRPSPNGIPTRTPVGQARIVVKMPSKHMGDGSLAADIGGLLNSPGVAWSAFFKYEHLPFQGHAFHGALYWHDNFGVPMRGSGINMRDG